MFGILLLTSNVQIFGQEQSIQLFYGMEDFIREIIDIDNHLFELYEKLEDPRKLLENFQEECYSREQLCNEKENFLKELQEVSNQYGNKMTQYDYYLNIYRRTNKNELLEELSRPYFDPTFNSEMLNYKEREIILEMLPEQLIQEGRLSDYFRHKHVYVLPEIKFNQANRDIYILHENVFKARIAIEHMRDMIRKMNRNIKFFRKTEAALIRQKYTPLDIMEYAYKSGMLPKEKAGVKLTLEAMDADVALGTLVKNIRVYLTEFGTKIKNVKFYPAASLTRELKGMSLAERTEYVNELTDLERYSKTFIDDFEKLDRPARRYVGKSITKGFWVLAGLGAIATAAYITDIAADNHFSKNTISPREVGIIAKNIENGTATIREKFAFFTHPATEEYVKKDTVYTLSLVQFASDIYAADELLQEAQRTQGQQIKENVENGVLKNLEQKMSTTDFGVGTL